MFSAPASNYCTDITGRNSKFACKSYLTALPSGKPGSYLEDDSEWDSAKRMALSLILKLTLLGTHVFHVVKVGANAEMCRIAASSIADARMKHILHSRSVFSSVQNPRNSMGVKCSNWAESLGNSNLPVAIRLYEPSPIPAFTRTAFVDMGPEQFLKPIRQYLRQRLRWDNFRSHNSYFNRFVVPRSRLNQQREGIFIVSKT